MEGLRAGDYSFTLKLTSESNTVMKNVVIHLSEGERPTNTMVTGKITDLSGNLIDETVVLLSQRKADNHIEVDLDLDGLDVTSAESKATYNEIQQYVLKETGLMVSNLYIAQIKKKCGIDVGECFNKPKTENAKQPKCPEDKEKAIKDALKHFGMI